MKELENIFKAGSKNVCEPRPLSYYLGKLAEMLNETGRAISRGLYGETLNDGKEVRK